MGMTVLAWAVTIFLWVIAVAFAVSNVLILLALIHHRKDMEFVLILGVVFVAFAILAAGAACGALAVGRTLT